MLIMAVHQTPSLTQEKYEEVARRLTGREGSLTSPSDLGFEGFLVHAAGEGPKGFCIFDVFESEQAVNRFREAVATIPQRSASRSRRSFFPLHTCIAV
jgi:heme-degrading monooxygenase HmoA